MIKTVLTRHSMHCITVLKPLLHHSLIILTAHVFYFITTLSAMIEVCFDFFFFSNLRGCHGSRKSCVLVPLRPPLPLPVKRAP